MARPLAPRPREAFPARPDGPGGATLVAGLQWGDEGKGKVVDLLAASHDLVVRFNGGDNAGHALKVGGRRFAVRLVPAAILHPAVLKVIANGVAVNPATLLDEVEELEAAGLDLSRLALSDSAHLVMPWHAAADAGSGVRTMRQGIGPAYADKAGRVEAVRLGEVLDPAALAERLEPLAAARRPVLRRAGVRLRGAEVMRLLAAFAARFGPSVTCTQRLLNRAVAAGQRLLLEGAQGALLDVDHGTFPWVTSSATVAGGAATGTGLPPSAIRRVVGVVKAYCTRVGSGPFPSELDPALADELRQRGIELGTATGALRRCGWLDLVALRHAAMLDRPDELVLTKVDVLGGLGRVGVCTAYRVGGARTADFPTLTAALVAARPELTTVPGWPALDRTGWERVRDGRRLPDGLRRFVELVEESAGAPVRTLSFGPSREETVELGG